MKRFSTFAVATAMATAMAWPAYADHNGKTKNIWNKLSKDSQTLVKEVQSRHKDICKQDQKGRSGYIQPVVQELKRNGTVVGKTTEAARGAGRYLANECAK